MTKRDDGKFERREKDHYPTPLAAVIPLLPHLTRTRVRTFVEPCAGVGRKLVKHLTDHGLRCVAAGDITDTPGRDAADSADWEAEDYVGVDACITNTPWTHEDMVAIMLKQSYHVPSWFLVYSDWIFTKQSADIMKARCTDIVPIGRLKWIPGSASVGFDNCCWLRMDMKNLPPHATFWPFP